MKKILVVEDDAYISGMLYDLLTQNRYAVTLAYSGSEALLRLDSETFDLVLLDLMLPGKSGDEVLEELRKKSNINVLVLTAVTDKETTARILRLGADDYLTKPFDNGELLARIDARLRRGSGSVTLHPMNAEVRFKDIILDLDGYDAVLGENRAQLSKREFEILKLLMSYPQKVFTKDNLYESVWGGEFMGDDNTVNVHISKLRAKLHALDPNCEYIQTIRGIGYKMA